MKGGVRRIHGETDLIAADYFFMNSKFSLITKSSRGGILIKAELNPNIGSPYMNTRDDIVTTPVMSVLIKMVFICDVNEPFEIKSLNIFNNPTSPAQFNNEVTIQRDIFLKSSETGNSICPAIIFNNIYTDQGRELLRQILVESDEILAYIMIYIIQMHSRGYHVGIIIMENLIGYISAYEFITAYPAYKHDVEIRILHKLIKLCQAGYLHGDPTQFNFMINQNMNVIIIDFGLSFTVLNIDRLNQLLLSDPLFIAALTLYVPYPNWYSGNGIQSEWRAYQWLNAFVLNENDDIRDSNNEKIRELHIGGLKRSKSVRRKSKSKTKRFRKQRYLRK